MAAPVEGSNIAYAEHVYPIHVFSSYDHHFGDISNFFPVLITEWGFIEKNVNSEDFFLVGNEDDFGEVFLEYLDESQIGWVACWFDDSRLPAMFITGFQELNSYGSYVIRQLIRDLDECYPCFVSWFRINMEQC